jgi:hypothetical protein
MAVDLYPLPSLFDPTVSTIRDSTPVNTSAFYLRRPHTVPWSADPTTFVLETDQPTQPHTFTINRTETFTIVPGQTPYGVGIQLAQRANRIEVTVGTTTTVFGVAATGVETWFRALGREAYIRVTEELTEIENQFNSPWTTRITAHLLPYADLFLASQMPKIQQTRMAIVAAMGRRLGFGDGVRQVATALAYSTPLVTKARDSEFALPGRDPLYPGITSHPTTAELRGRTLDLWFPNSCAAAKNALTRMALSMGGQDVPNPKPLELVDFDDRQVLLRLGGGPIEVCALDPLEAGCQDLESDLACDSNIRAWVDQDSRIEALMTTPQLPFDEQVENPILFGTWDQGFELDGVSSGSPGLGGGDTFDNVDPDDPWGTGFLGVSLSQRFDAGACLDTRIQVAQRLEKFCFPLGVQTPDLVVGSAAVVDAAAGAPQPLIGNQVVWLVSPRTYMQAGDLVRFPAPDGELRVATAWPAFQANRVVKTTTATVVAGVHQTTLVSGSKTFSFRHTGMGVRVQGVQKACVVKVSPDGTTAWISGNPAIVPAGAQTVELYEPIRDRRDLTEAPYSGHRTFEVGFTTTFAATQPDGFEADYRMAPVAQAAASLGDSFIQVSTDTQPLPSDLLYLSPTQSTQVVNVTDLEIPNPTTGFPTYMVEVQPALAASVLDGQALYGWRTSACWSNGSPVTPLTVVSFGSSSYLVASGGFVCGGDYTPGQSTNPFVGDVVVTSQADVNTLAGFDGITGSLTIQEGGFNWTPLAGLKEITGALLVFGDMFSVSGGMPEFPALRWVGDPNPSGVGITCSAGTGSVWPANLLPQLTRVEGDFNVHTGPDVVDFTGFQTMLHHVGGRVSFTLDTGAAYNFTNCAPCLVFGGVRIQSFSGASVSLLGAFPHLVATAGSSNSTHGLQLNQVLITNVTGAFPVLATIGGPQGSAPKGSTTTGDLRLTDLPFGSLAPEFPALTSVESSVQISSCTNVDFSGFAAGCFPALTAAGGIDVIFNDSIKFPNFYSLATIHSQLFETVRILGNSNLLSGPPSFNTVTSVVDGGIRMSGNQYADPVNWNSAFMNLTSMTAASTSDLFVEVSDNTNMGGLDGMFQNLPALDSILIDSNPQLATISNIFQNLVGSTVNTVTVTNNTILPTAAEAQTFINSLIATGFVGTATNTGNGPG